ncbi:MAG: hypothetical protein KatS3mg102_1595 [Planctomycetota bacterium]|nr:MAG: hypothetical protein KatS3mg102_1595 [Planctomycetota bacterium]
MIRTAHAAASWLAALAFAALFGGHLFETCVLVPHWSASPEALRSWLAAPQRPDVPGYMAVLVPAALGLALLAPLLGLLAERRRLWPSVLAAGCMLGHLAIVLVVFVPMERALGLLPPPPGTAPPALGEAELAALLQQWRAWNGARLVLDAAALCAAIAAAGNLRLPEPPDDDEGRAPGAGGPTARAPLPGAAQPCGS